MNTTRTQQPPLSICVYSSSSDMVDPAYFATATALGAAIGGRGDRLVFGGSNTGLMDAVARAVKDHGGEVVGVIPEVMRGTPYVFDRADEIVTTKDLRARKAEMETRADAFVALPGGLGTLDELIEVLAAKQMQFHEKPIVLLNCKDFYEPLAILFEHLFREGFASAEHHRPLYHLANDIEEALSYIDAYAPAPFPVKWF
ncbi:MAG TPA: TIGR00730 family Rossman fold protein [Thermoanaerobaculia bacterium]